MTYGRLTRGSIGRSISHTGGRGTQRAVQYDSSKQRMATRSGQRAAKLDNTVENTNLEATTRKHNDSPTQTVRNKPQEDDKLETTNKRSDTPDEELLTEIDKLLNSQPTSAEDLFTTATSDTFNNMEGLKIKKEATTAYWEETTTESIVTQVDSNFKVAADPMEIVVEDVLDDSDNEVVEIPMAEVSHRQTKISDIMKPSATSKRRLQSEGTKRKSSKKFFADVKSFETEFYTNVNDTSDLSDSLPPHSTEDTLQEMEQTNIVDHTEQRSNGAFNAVSVLVERPTEDLPLKHDSLSKGLVDKYATGSADERGTRNETQNSTIKAGSTSTKKVTFQYDSFSGSSSDETDTTSPFDNTSTGRNIPDQTNWTGNDIEMILPPSERVSAKPSAKQTTASSTDYTYYTGPGKTSISRRSTTDVSTHAYKKNNWGSSPQLRVIALSNSSVDQRLQNRGQAMVEDSTYLCTPVKIEFNIAKDVIEYNARKHLLILLKKMQASDDSLRIQSSIKEEVEWVDLDTIPEAEEFADHFQMKDFTYRTHKKVIVHMKLISVSPVNRIKYSRHVKEHIYQENIWLKTDKYNAKIESSPGFFTKVHPKLVHREDFVREMTNTLIQLQPQHSEKVVTDWYQLHNRPLPIKGASITIPAFHLEPSVKKWGNIKTEVLRVTCSTDDAEYLKFLLSSASNNESFRSSTFVPAGLHLMQGKEIVSSILREHQQYLLSTIGTPITGLVPQAMNSMFNDTDITVKEMIEAFDEVHSVQRTGDTDHYGRWLVVSSEEHREVVLNKLNESLALIYKAQHGQRRIITAGTRQIQSDQDGHTTVGTYAEILSRKYASKLPLPKAVTEKAKNSRQFTNKPPVAKTTPSFRPTDTPMEHTLTKDSTKLSQEFNELANRLKSLEAKQAELANNPRPQQVEQSKKTQENIQSLADKQNELLHFEERMEKKLNEMEVREKTFLQETEATIIKQIDNKLESKLNTVSKLVASHVTSQLMEAMQQYMQQSVNRSSPQIQTTELPMLTQEVFSPDDKQITDVTQISAAFVNRIKPTNMTDMKQALSEIDTTSHTPCPPHDNFIGHSESTNE